MGIIIIIVIIIIACKIGATNKFYFKFASREKNLNIIKKDVKKNYYYYYYYDYYYLWYINVVFQKHCYLEFCPL